MRQQPCAVRVHAGCLPFLLASFHVFSRLNMKYTAEMLTGSAQASTVAEECFGNIRTVRP
jgi:hypothetical protein